jgi:acetyl-CoA acyltransferase
MGFNSDPNPRFLAEKLVSPDALNMGCTAEKIHDRFPNLTKERADAYAVRSQHRAAKAYENNRIQPDLIPVSAASQEGWKLVTRDEQLRPESTLEGMKDLKTPFRPHGKVTAGNASPLTDGATVSLLAGERAVKEHGFKPRMRMVSFAFAGVEPEIMGIGPIPATEKALKKAGLSITDIGAFEINEAFAIQVLSFLDHFGIADDDERVNPWGGAIAFGHPLASSGVRLMNQLSRQFELNPSIRYGMTTMCIGLGMGGTVIWENTAYRGK